jgi:hypothetical protein
MLDVGYEVVYFFRIPSSTTYAPNCCLRYLCCLQVMSSMNLKHVNHFV